MKRYICLLLAVVVCMPLFSIPAAAAGTQHVGDFIGQTVEGVIVKGTDIATQIWNRVGNGIGQSFAGMADVLYEIAQTFPGIDPDNITPEQFDQIYDAYSEDVNAKLGTGIVSKNGLVIPLTPAPSYIQHSSQYGDTVLNAYTYPAYSNVTSYVLKGSSIINVLRNLWFDDANAQFIPPSPGHLYIKTDIAERHGEWYWMQASYDSPSNQMAVAAGRLYDLSTMATLYSNEPTPQIMYLKWRSCIIFTPLGYNVNTTTAPVGGADLRMGNIPLDLGYYDASENATVIEKSYLFDESTSTFYNPFTDNSQVVNDWSYDYSDRSYTLTTSTGDTTTVTYGNEYVTIQEGDTVYNYYYLMDSSQIPEPTEPPAHVHKYDTQTVTTPATCTMPGVRENLCSCGEFTTTAIPATGHTWTVKENVPTQYGTGGELIQAGYTIYKCDSCGEEKRTESGASPPPSGGGGTGSIPSGLFGIVAELFAFINSFFIDFVGGSIRDFLDMLTNPSGGLFGLFNATW
jgi:hypothetical protein